MNAPSQTNVSGYDASARSTGRSVFQCPSGINEVTQLQYGVTNPTSRKDARGLGFSRRGYEVPVTATTTKILGNYDTWYTGLCSASGQASRRNIFPFRYNKPVLATGQLGTDDNGDAFSLCRFSQIMQPQSTALLFDGGAWDDVVNTMITFVNVHHNNWQVANIQFADGHVEPVADQLIPPGGVSGELSYENLTEWRKYPRVLWRLDQQQ